MTKHLSTTHDGTGSRRTPRPESHDSLAREARPLLLVQPGEILRRAKLGRLHALRSTGLLQAWIADQSFQDRVDEIILKKETKMNRFAKDESGSLSVEMCIWMAGLLAMGMAFGSTVISPLMDNAQLQSQLNAESVAIIEQAISVCEAAE